MLYRNKAQLAFDVGFSAMLYFTATKCRSLDIRLKALSLMEMLRCGRYNTWHQPLLCAVVRRVIEMEHSVSLQNDGLTYEPASGAPLQWPVQQERVVRVKVAEAKIISGHAV